MREAALWFNGSVILLGILLLTAAYFIRHVFHSPLVAILLALTGIGAVGVGVFPAATGLTGLLHDVFALLVFLFGPVTAIYVGRFLPSPLLPLSIILGALALVALGLFLSGNYLGLGRGGMQRMFALPLLAWYITLGGYLMAGEAR